MSSSSSSGWTYSLAVAEHLAEPEREEHLTDDEEEDSHEALHCVLLGLQLSLYFMAYWAARSGPRSTASDHLGRHTDADGHTPA